MSSGANDISLLLTGSIRNALKMMLESSRQPIFGEAAQMQLPEIGRADFLECLVRVSIPRRQRSQDRSGMTSSPPTSSAED